MVVARNQLLLGLLAAAALYILVGTFAPHPWISFSGAAAQLIGGGLALGMYGVDALKIVASPSYRNPDSPKSHRLVLGVALVGLGVAYSGFASVLYISNDSPATWIGNPFFYAGRYIAAAGFVFLYLAPDEKRTYLSFRPSLTAALLMIMALAVMFYLGLRVGANPPTAFEGSVHQSAPTYPACAEDEPYWGSTSERYHHVQESPYIGQMKGPVRCFKTEAEAQANGFRRPG